MAVALTIAVVMGAGSRANAQEQIYWQDSEIEAPPLPHVLSRRPHHAKRHHVPKTEEIVKASRKPQGPLLIAISIDRQTLKIYDGNGLFAETPVSTGMRGHSTPLGVFSVIQKQKWHRSNIYSGAPMPYMQRITWSGIAIHAGVLPGYPASHGCIRMPTSFAVKMYSWTRMGARVVITPGEVTPAQFSHPLLITHRLEAIQTASADTPSDGLQSQKADKASGTPAPIAMAGAANDPKSGIDATKSVVGMALPAGDVRTADASGALPQLTAPSGTASASADHPDSTEHNSVNQAAVTAPAADLRSGIETNNKPAQADAKADVPKADTAKIDAGKAETNAKPDANAKAGIDAKVHVVVATATSSADTAGHAKDQSRSPDMPKDAAKLEATAAPMPKRTGPIAVFVSRKDNKIYVRQNFTPLFDAPVTITPSDRPLGTHVFTAEADNNNKTNFHWSVVSLPVIAHYAASVAASRSDSRWKKRAIRAEAKLVPAQDDAAEALARITIPEDIMSKIAESLSPGSSIVVSDQGIAGGETGQGTDFIVTLR